MNKITKRVLVTGGAGFIGSHTCIRLIDQGYRVRVLDNLHPQIHPNQRWPEHLPKAVELVRGDVRDPEIVREAFENVSAVFHFAAETGVGQSMHSIGHYVDVNVHGTAVVIEEITRRRNQIDRFVLSSSRAVYGEGRYDCPRCGPQFPEYRDDASLGAGQWQPRCAACDAPLQPAPTDEEAPTNPVSIYAVTKKHQEDLARILASLGETRVVILRYFNVFGEHQAPGNPYTGILPLFFNRLRARRPVELYEEGLPVRDFVHVSDVVDANMLAMTAETGRFALFNVGTGRPVTLAEAAAALKSHAGDEGEIRITRKYRRGDIFGCYANIDRLRQIGFAPAVSLETGLARLTGWLSRTALSEDRSEAVEAELVKHDLLRESR